MLCVVAAFHRFFGGSQRIDRVRVADLRREKLRLEQVARRIGRDVERAEARREALFLQGQDEASPRRRFDLARRIRELDARVRIKGQQQASFHEQLWIVNGLLQIKESEELLRQRQTGSVVAGMSIGELTDYVEEAVAWGQFERERLAELREPLTWALDVAAEMEVDKELAAIVATMEAAQSAEVEGWPEDEDLHSSIFPCGAPDPDCWSWSTGLSRSSSHQTG
jgi:hypothetical protein